MCVCRWEEISGQLVSRSTTTHASDGQNLPRAEITLPLWVTHTDVTVIKVGASALNFTESSLASNVTIDIGNGDGAGVDDS